MSKCFSFLFSFFVNLSLEWLIDCTQSNDKTLQNWSRIKVYIWSHNYKTISSINNLRNSAIQSKEIIFILRMWQRGSLSELNDSKLWCIDSKSWCHERQVRFILNRKSSACNAPGTQAFIYLSDDRHAWTDRNSLTGIDRQWVQK